MHNKKVLTTPATVVANFEFGGDRGAFFLSGAFFSQNYSHTVFTFLGAHDAMSMPAYIACGRRMSIRPEQVGRRWRGPT